MLAFSIHHWLLLLCLSVAAAPGGTDATRSTSPPYPTRSNFLRAAVLGGRRQRLMCTADPGVCSDRKENPWGGSTCCFQQYCKDTARDPDHCGDCGRRCAYGLLCCGGECTDVRDDPDHCGSCYNRCTAGIWCSFGMCGYGH